MKGGEIIMKWNALTPQSQIEAQERYDKDNTTQIRLKLNLRTDADILAHLKERKAMSGGMQGYIKALIRADMREHKVSNTTKQDNND